MRRRDVVIDQLGAVRIDAILSRFRAESAARAALLIDDSGQLVASADAYPPFDAEAVAALTAGVFNSTAAIARLLGQPAFTVLFHEGAKESLHVAAVDEHTLLLAIADELTMPGIVRLLAQDATDALRAALTDTREQCATAVALAPPLTTDASLALEAPAA